HQWWWRLGSSDPPPLRGRRHYESRQPSHSGHRAAGEERRVAPACFRYGAVSGPVRRVRRLLPEPLPQHRARGPRHAVPLQLLAAAGVQVGVTQTPNPTPDGVVFTTPEILPEGDPRTPA